MCPLAEVWDAESCLTRGRAHGCWGGGTAESNWSPAEGERLAGSGWEEATAEPAGGRLAVLVRDPLVALRTGHEMQNLQRLVLGLASWSLPFSSLHLRTCWSQNQVIILHESFWVVGAVMCGSLSQLLFPFRLSLCPLRLAVLPGKAQASPASQSHFCC